MITNDCDCGGCEIHDVDNCPCDFCQGFRTGRAVERERSQADCADLLEEMVDDCATIAGYEGGGDALMLALMRLRAKRGDKAAIDALDDVARRKDRWN